MTYIGILFPSPVSRISGALHTIMEYPYLLRLPNSTYIEKENYLLWNNSLTEGSRPDNWRSLTDADYTSKYRPSPTSPMGMEHTLKKGTMMFTNIIFVKLPTHGLLKDTQDQNNGNCGTRPSENASQVIITQHILTKLVNGNMNAKTLEIVLS